MNRRWAARAGRTGFHLDRDATAAALGFDRPTANSLDAVSDRDFVVDYLHAAALCSVHLSRWPRRSSLGIAAVRLRQAARRLVDRIVDHAQQAQSGRSRAGRGHSARIVGDLVACWSAEGLPLAYAKDLQDDKPPCSTRMTCWSSASRPWPG
jgi:argininosuccinate lyase